MANRVGVKNIYFQRVRHQEVLAVLILFLPARSSSMLALIKPIYGNGWIYGDTDIEVPQPFLVETSVFQCDRIEGLVASDVHKFAGCQFWASARHTNADNNYNCSVTLLDNTEVIGYCIIE
jgi:hypothetical protein